ncbi:MAG: ArsR family transcriptional regulator [Deltaproteobacteria bacterium]|nr:ArsR family transcriptional regulator [Deltaproteobacteria bacterium]
MASPVRISPAEAREKAVSKDALLVCACDDGDQLRRIKLEGSITLSELRGRLPGLTKEQGLIFYCA